MQKEWRIRIKLFIIITLFLISVFNATAQRSGAKEDLRFFRNTTHEKKHFHKRGYLMKDASSNFVKYNPVSLTLGGLLYIYQNSISRQFSANCLYHPSCSDFSKRAISKYGFIKGILLSTDRLTRCNKIAGTDIHPITLNDSSQKSHDPVKLYK